MPGDSFVEYIINNRLIYNENDSCLSLKDDDGEPVMLTATLNRLLALLVRNNGTTLPRDMLLQQVWEVYGQVASNHNLNNNISMLRKLLAGLGEDNLIATQPKIGFRFAALELQAIGVEGASASSASPGGLGMTEQAKSGRTFSLLRVVIMAVVTLLVGALYGWSGTSRTLPEAMLGKFNRIGECRVQLLSRFHRAQSQDIDRVNLQQALASAGISCDRPAQVYYYNNDVLVPGVGQTNAIFFISYCPMTTIGGKRIQCENIYANRHV